MNQAFTSITLAVAFFGASADLPVAIGRDWSAFRSFATARHPPPQVEDPEWSRNPVDAFVFSRLHREQLVPAPLVDRRIWLRRVTFDLTGLPPSPGRVQAFLGDPRSDHAAYGAVVDRLLASGHYGEHWARHWLDVVRYADSDGFAIDAERPTLWRYRDYVIRAFDEDRPFDRFIRQQLAADEIQADREHIVATGFYRLGPWEADNMVPENKRQDYLNEITSTVGSAFLGLTIGCARCHDHKYDPISQEDFYRLQAFFTPLKRKSVKAELTRAEMTEGVRRRKAESEAERSRLRGNLESFRNSLKTKLASAAGKPKSDVTNEELDQIIKKKSDKLSDEDHARHSELKKIVDDYKDTARYAAIAYAIENPESDSKGPATYVLLGGDVFNPGHSVQPGFLSAVTPWSHPLAPKVAGLGNSASGRRRVLAEWIASAQNPLTARVLVNRVWQYHMGRGIITTANDFGANGSGPSHPNLLDYLASWFVQHEWRLKPLHRLLVLSRTYRMSSSHPGSAACATVDPDNRLLWRAPLRRLEAEAVRDTMLAVSGRLNREQGGPGFFEMLPREMSTKLPFFTWKASAENLRRRRSIYMFQRRNLVHPMMEVFDSADMNQSCERRETSVTSPQVFSLFNSTFAHQISAEFARRVLRESGDEPKDQVDQLFWQAFGRPPEPNESEACILFLQSKTDGYQDEPTATSGNREGEDALLAALSDLCLVAMNLNEFIYID